jgi:predicted DNA-binding WGR domain protein
MPLIDSKHSLDADSPMRDSVVMIAQPYQLYIERTDASKNMARFYAMAIEPTLFGDICLTRRWGRIGAQGQMMKHSFAREDEAVRLFLDLLRQKRNRGYHPKGKKAATQPDRCLRRRKAVGSHRLGDSAHGTEPPRKRSRLSEPAVHRADYIRG